MGQESTLTDTWSVIPPLFCHMMSSQCKDLKAHIIDPPANKYVPFEWRFNGGPLLVILDRTLARLLLLHSL